MGTSCWREIQKTNFRDLQKLADFLQLSEKDRTQIHKASKFVLNLPFRLAEKIQKGTLRDPILKQFLPHILETFEREGFDKDPVKDETFRKESKLLQKYKGRALLLTTSACAMNCRFCFRQNFDYTTKDQIFLNEIAALKKDTSLSEIILSGGDPLSLHNRTLQKLISELDSIPHLKRYRFHTRFPIGIPERIDSEFLNLLGSTRMQAIFVIHCNHPKELDETILKKLKEIQKLGIPVLSQTVLLKEVNDDAATLKELFTLMVDHGIQPYYLHQLDKLSGAQHFEVEEKKGHLLIEELSKELSGYAIPRYVREIPNRPSKTPLHSVQSFQP